MTSGTPRHSDDSPQVPGNARAGGTAESGGAVVRVFGCPLPRWGRWGAVGAFMFFLIKGLLWLTLPAILVAWRSCTGQ